MPSLKKLQFWVNFTIFDPRKLPKAKEDLKMYGNKELSELLSHYAVSKTDIFKANRISAAADIDFDKVKSKCSGFKYLMFQKRENYYHFIDSKIAAVLSPGNECKSSVTNLKKECTMFSPKLFWESFSTDDPMRQLYPNLFFLLYMLNIFPLSAACVERLVSRIKTNLIKVDKVDKNVPEKPTVPSKA